MLHERLGLNDDIRAHTDRIAAAGYLAVAPDLFSWGPKARWLVSTIRQLRFGHQGRTLQDVRAVARWLGRRDDCTGRVGTLGFCMGGGLAILLAPSPEFAASAPNYGPVPDDAETALAGACPIVASFGGRDRMLRGHARRVEAALTTLGVAHDVREYPEAGHSFLSRHGPALRALGAALAVGSGSRRPRTPGAGSSPSSILTCATTTLRPAPDRPRRAQSPRGEVQHRLVKSFIGRPRLLPGFDHLRHA